MLLDPDPPTGPRLTITVDVEHPNLPVADATASIEAILDVACSHGQPVNFFVQGRWASSYPSLSERMAAMGSNLGLHGHAHIDFRRLSNEGIAAEVEEGLAVLNSVLSYRPVRYFRFPYGAGATCSAARTALADRGLTAVGWDYSSRDWDSSVSDEDAWLRIEPATRTGGVILFHSWVPRTAALIARLIANRRRATVVDLDDLPLAHEGIGGQVHLQPEGALR